MNANLILISNSERFEDQEYSNSIVLVRQKGKKLIAPFGSLDAPDKFFLLRKYVRADLSDWIHTLDWLLKLDKSEENGGYLDFADATLVIDFDHPLRELVLVAAKLRKLRYGLFIDSTVERVTVPEYALLGSSAGIFFGDPSLKESLKRAYIGPFTSYLLTPDGIANFLTDARKQSRSTNIALQPNYNARRVLVVSYFSGPCRTVGVQRVNYWLDEIGKLADKDTEVHLATSINWTSEGAFVHYVPDLNIATLLSDDAKFLNWAPAFHELECNDAKHFNTLSYYWRYALERYFEALDMNFDVVVISGNPFSVFDFAAFAKRTWYAKVLLDYRDPFANNPRMKMNEKAREHARFVERGFNFQADALLSVNDVCLEYFEGGENTKKVTVANGYDERSFANVSPIELAGDSIKFVHAGSFYHDRSPRSLITSIDPDKHSIHHIGSLNGIDEDLLNVSGLVCHGSKPYQETLALIGGGDCGIVYITETGFETPTKLYEYLAFGLDILICTNGPIEEGAIARVLDEYPGVHWCKNSDEGISKFLEAYKPTKLSGKDNSIFTRRHSTKKLIAVIDDLVTSGAQTL